MKSLLMVISLLFLSLSVQSWQTMTSKKIYVKKSPIDTCQKLRFSLITENAVKRVEEKVAKLEKAKKRN